MRDDSTEYAAYLEGNPDWSSEETIGPSEVLGSCGCRSIMSIMVSHRAFFSSLGFVLFFLFSFSSNSRDMAPDRVSAGLGAKTESTVSSPWSIVSMVCTLLPSYPSLLSPTEYSQDEAIPDAWGKAE